MTAPLPGRDRAPLTQVGDALAWLIAIAADARGGGLAQLPGADLLAILTGMERRVREAGA